MNRLWVIAILALTAGCASSRVPTTCEREQILGAISTRLASDGGRIMNPDRAKISIRERTATANYQYSSPTTQFAFIPMRTELKSESGDWRIVGHKADRPWWWRVVGHTVGVK